MHTIMVLGSIFGIWKEAALNQAELGHRILGLYRAIDQSKQAHEEILAQTEKEY